MTTSESRARATEWASYLRRFSPLAGVLLFAIALFVVHRQIEQYRWDEIKQALFSLSPLSVTIAFSIMLLSYLILGLYDWLGLEYCNQRLPYRKVALASFLGYALSNNVGYAVLSGGSIRYRLYTAWGLPGAAIAQLLLFLSATYFISVLFLLVCAYLVVPADIVLTRNLPIATIELLVAGAALLMLGWWYAVLWRRGTLRIKQFTLTLPTPWLALRQTLVGSIDLLLSAMVLYVLLIHHSEISLSAFLTLFLLAQLIGVVSQVPGGIGIFEGSFLFLLQGQLPTAHVLAALMAFRAIYYFAPLALASVILMVYEFRHISLLHSPPLRRVFSAIETSIPQVFSIVLLFAGAVLLFSGATPGLTERIHWLHFFLPLPVLELSHLAGSIAGLSLLFLARAVRNRIDAAYFAAIVMLIVGIVASLAKGFDYEEALILTATLLAFLPTRRHFYRRSALLQLDLSIDWLVLIGIILVASTWLGFFSYKHIEYSHDLWWQFSFRGDASRFLRSLFVLCLVVGVFSVYRLMTHIPASLTKPDAVEIARALALVRHARDTSAHLALMGDKYLLWSDSGNSFLMFDITRKFWIAMGDPVGASDEHADLVWKFRELADRHGARIAFYQVGTQDLPLYLDIGLALSKLGEEARVDLEAFGLEGRKRQNLRSALNKLQREGAQFEVVSGAELEPLLDELERVSAQWMASKRAREKRFSLGFFDRDYLQRCDVAIVRLNGQIVAFSNLWQLDDHNELSMDLMRYDITAPNGVMEYLTLSVMVWAKARGYRWFSLGMAPLSGLEQHPLAPLWHKIGNTVFRFGHEFYNFEGLFLYKNKFDPVWQPRYLAAPAGLSMASVLLAVTTLISGGVRGIFTK